MFPGAVGGWAGPSAWLRGLGWWSCWEHLPGCFTGPWEHRVWRRLCVPGSRVGKGTCGWGCFSGAMQCCGNLAVTQTELRACRAMGFSSSKCLRCLWQEWDCQWPPVYPFSAEWSSSCFRVDLETLNGRCYVFSPFCIRPLCVSVLCHIPTALSHSASNTAVKWLLFSPCLGPLLWREAGQAPLVSLPADITSFAVIFMQLLGVNLSVCA
jgi:hypothetical protein